MRFCILIVILNINLLFSFAQSGKILIVGGGSESNDFSTSWNAEAYKWAVDQSDNKKVAVIHYSSTGDWLRPYFTDHCGAETATNFVINNSNANDTNILNQLAEHDVFFFRGGDQYYYYTYYRGTKMEETIRNKFEEGGVISGTSAGLAILSEVIFWAENGSAYSNECIVDINHNTITLADDFLDIAPGYLFDSHFTDRGRMGRLLAFMANYQKTKGASVIGIGIDGTTAFAIDQHQTGIAFGTGAVNLYRVSEGKEFGPGPWVDIDSLEMTQLLHGDSIHLETWEIFGLDQKIHPEVVEEKSNHTLYLSGSDNLSATNIEMLEKLVNDGGGIQDEILIVTGSSTTLAEQFQTKLNELGAENVDIRQALYAYADDAGFNDAINASKKVIFLENTTYNLNIFLISGNTGTLLSNHIGQSEILKAFIGDNARLAGPWAVGKYLSSNGSSSGLLTFSEGFGLLETTVIIPNTLKVNEGNGKITDFWHTTHAALPYTMVTKALKYGIWLTSKNFIIFQPEEDKNTIQAFGDIPVMILTMPKPCRTAVAEQTYNGQENEEPRMIAGFDKMYFTTLGDQEKLTIGGLLSSDQQMHKSMPEIRIYPDPANSSVTIEWVNQQFDLELFNSNGSRMGNYKNITGSLVMATDNLIPGIYIASLHNNNGTMIYSKKFLILR